MNISAQKYENPHHTVRANHDKGVSKNNRKTVTNDKTATDIRNSELALGHGQNDAELCPINEKVSVHDE